MKQNMNGPTIKSVGIVKATGIIGLIKLTNNIFTLKNPMSISLLVWLTKCINNKINVLA